MIRTCIALLAIFLSPALLEAQERSVPARLIKAGRLLDVKTGKYLVQHGRIDFPPEG
jgi:hypothetical protein